MTTWSFQSLTPHESIIPLSKLVIRKISHKTSECSCILTSFSPPKQFESVTFPTKKNKFTLTLCERCCCFATFFGSWFVQVLRTSVPRRVSHLGSKDRRMVCKATRGVYGCCTLECSIGIKKEGHIYIYTVYCIYLYRCIYHLLLKCTVNAGKMGTHIPKDLKILFFFIWSEHIWMCDRSCSGQPVCCTSGWGPVQISTMPVVEDAQPENGFLADIKWAEVESKRIFHLAGMKNSRLGIVHVQAESFCT